MAIYRLEAKIISRQGRGRSVIAAAAYRAATRLHDELKDKIYDYARRVKGVVANAVLAPENAPEWSRSSEQLWNRVEATERRKDGRLAREFLLALPKELSPEARYELATGWAKRELVSKGMVVELSIHEPKDHKNPHSHLLCTTRRIDGENFSAKKPTEWNDVVFLKHLRVSWCYAVNAALAEAGCSQRVDHRSLKERGIDRIPEPKIGVEATAMKRRGVEADPENFKRVRAVKMLNEVRPMMRAIEKGGEVAQKGHGTTWWERSITFMDRLRERATQVIKSGWRKLLDGKPARDVGEGKDFTR